MNRLIDTFASLRVLLPVVHVRSQEQGARNARTAMESGADGVFFISHGALDHRELNALALAFKWDHPSVWVGVNYLDLPDPLQAARTAVQAGLDGLWVDNAEIREEVAQTIPAAVCSELLQSDAPPLLFGGVAFKYQRPVRDLSKVATVAARYMDVITTSGSGTGVAADPAKLEQMAHAARGTPLGLASGISAANVHLYLPYVTCYLVASSLIGDEPDEFVPERVSELAGIIHAWEPARS